MILPVLLAGKESKKMTFAQIGEAIGRNEVAVAAIFYGQSTATEADAAKLAEVLGLDHQLIAPALLGFPDRGKLVDMPPREPMIYRLYEIVQNYGYAYKAVINEKFGDGIMSAISFSTTVEKETDEKGDWVVIRLRGKWSVERDCAGCDPRLLMSCTGCLSQGSRCMYSMKAHQLHAIVLPLPLSKDLSIELHLYSKVRYIAVSCHSSASRLH